MPAPDGIIAIGVQAQGCQPLKRAWETGRPPQRVEAETIADGIAVAEPVAGALALRDVRETAGAFVAASDDPMLVAVRRLARRPGCWPSRPQPQG